ncbi:hypothetical protein [Evansella tamaricis]|uniref:Chorismate mutase n=1 Tax=Evansella tamaricis TaxID=2069301 RepID=A0ABS6JGN0_9BACI|nr:hypothetical protein [Evansella tamaricis]MBU9712825.1 hypothetical protein [Evansella tamaricis]
MWKRMPFERPTTHYDKRVALIDEKICALIGERKLISENDPGYPELENIARWSTKYGLCEEMVQVFFETLRTEDSFRPVVEPVDFKRYVKVLQSKEMEETFYSVPFIRQYSNASMVTLNVDWPPSYDYSLNDPTEHNHFFQLEIKGDSKQKYECRGMGGGGTSSRSSYDFIISPALPDDLSGLVFIFKDYNGPNEEELTGLQLEFKMASK